MTRAKSHTTPAQDHETSNADERPLSFLGRSAPAGMAVRIVSIPAHTDLVYEPSEWDGALVIVEAGEVELACHTGARARFGAGSVLFFDGLPLRAVRNSAREPALLSAVSRFAER